MFDTILTNLVARLATAAQGSAPRVVITPLPGPVPITGEAGTWCLVGSPEPDPTSGAGRWGYKVRRTVLVVVVTACTLDPGGRDELAVAKHLRAELAVADACMDFKAAPIAVGGGAYQILWVPGGEEMSRKLKPNPALLTSVLAFDVHYSAGLTPGV